jgi:hypothetical protein
VAHEVAEEGLERPSSEGSSSADSVVSSHSWTQESIDAEGFEVIDASVELEGYAADRMNPDGAHLRWQGNSALIFGETKREDPEPFSMSDDLLDECLGVNISNAVRAVMTDEWLSRLEEMALSHPAAGGGC